MFTKVRKRSFTGIIYFLFLYLHPQELGVAV